MPSTDPGVIVREALEDLTARGPAPDLTAAVHLAIDAAVEAARIRGARGTIAARARAGTPFADNARALSAAADRAADRAAAAAHDALNLLVVALGARS